MLSTGLTATALGLLALAPRLPRLARRYDGAALAPIEGTPAETADPRLLQRLATWAAEGAGHGATLLPWSRPALPVPLAIAATAGSFQYHFHSCRAVGIGSLTSFPLPWQPAFWPDRGEEARPSGHPR